MNHRRVQWNHSGITQMKYLPALSAGRGSGVCLGVMLWHNCGVTCNICLLYYNFLVVLKCVFCHAVKRENHVTRDSVSPFHYM